MFQKVLRPLKLLSENQIEVIRPISWNKIFLKGFVQYHDKEVTQIACILVASLIFSGYYLVMTSLSCQICGKTPAKLTES